MVRIWPWGRNNPVETQQSVDFIPADGPYYDNDGAINADWLGANGEWLGNNYNWASEFDVADPRDCANAIQIIKMLSKPGHMFLVFKAGTGPVGPRWSAPPV